MTQTIPVVILAGGLGTRIGGNKTAQLLCGRSLIDHMLRKAGRYSGEIAVAVRRSEDMALPAHIVQLEDDPGSPGPIAGLSSALKFAANGGYPVVLTLPCDTPFLPDNLLEKLQSALGSAALSVAQCNSRLHPTCGLWRTDAAGQLASYVKQGRRSLMGFAEAMDFVTAEWTPDPFDPFFNINTLDDLSTAEILADTWPDAAFQL